MTTRLMRTTAIHFTRRFSTAARHLLAPRPSTKPCAQRDGRPEAIATLHATLFTGAVAASSAAARRRASRPTGEHVPHDGHIALPLGAKPPLAPVDIPAKAKRKHRASALASQPQRAEDPPAAWSPSGIRDLWALPRQSWGRLSLEYETGRSALQQPTRSRRPSLKKE
jgi:hypothetical protein